MRSYLLVVSQDRTSAHTVTVYDLRNKLIAFAGNVGSVKMAVVEWGSIVLIGHDGRLHRLTEKDTLQKLDLLYKRNLYPMARKRVKRDLEIDLFRSIRDVFFFPRVKRDLEIDLFRSIRDVLTTTS